jgi:hypothetical protein
MRLTDCFPSRTTQAFITADHPEPTGETHPGRSIMLRSTLLLAILLMPTATLADKVVNSDGDSFFEVPATSPDTTPDMAGALSSVATSVLEALAPITSAQADEGPPAPQVPQLQVVDREAGYDIRHEFDGYYFDEPDDKRGR